MKSDKDTDQGHSETVVHELLKSTEHKEGHHLFADNFYSSTPLQKNFLTKKLFIAVHYDQTEKVFQTG